MRVNGTRPSWSLFHSCWGSPGPFLFMSVAEDGHRVRSFRFPLSFPLWVTGVTPLHVRSWGGLPGPHLKDVLFPWGDGWPSSPLPMFLVLKKGRSGCSPLCVLSLGIVVRSAPLHVCSWGGVCHVTSWTCFCFVPPGPLFSGASEICPFAEGYHEDYLLGFLWCFLSHSGFLVGSPGSGWWSKALYLVNHLQSIKVSGFQFLNVRPSALFFTAVLTPFLLPPRFCHVSDFLLNVLVSVTKPGTWQWWHQKWRPFILLWQFLCFALLLHFICLKTNIWPNLY